MGVFDFEIFALETGTHESQSRGNKWAFEVDAFYAPLLRLANQLGSVLCGFPEELQCGPEGIAEIVDNNTACGHRLAHRIWKLSNCQACCLAQLCLAAA